MKIDKHIVSASMNYLSFHFSSETEIEEKKISKLCSGEIKNV